jgi:APA family basic amino acid/polyamine antiporter
VLGVVGCAVLGVVGCAVLVVSLPAQSVHAGLVMFAVGIAGRALVRRRSRSN